MKLEEARSLLADSSEDEEPAFLPPGLLSELKLDDIPDGGRFEVGAMDGDVQVPEWEGRIVRRGDELEGEAVQTNTRKYWYEPLGLEQYMDLVRRAVETRHRLRGDVELINHDDDGAYIHLRYSIRTGTSDPRTAYERAKKISEEIEEAAQQAADEVGKRIAEVAARLSGWGTEPLDALVEKVSTGTTADDKGRSLEELASRLFEQVPGFSVGGRIRTATEEIDISIINDASEARLRREAALILAECKNWSSKCGKDELVVFREKMENRNRRCTLGFLISWNGFTGTVTKELLRGSREGALIVPMTGEDIRAAVRARDFMRTLLSCWDAAVAL